MLATSPLLKISDFPAIHRQQTETLQVNLGYRCNQSCIHCHVNAGPKRKEMMSRENLDLILPVLKARNIGTLDLTGGAPELHTGFRGLVGSAVAAGIHVIDRCNLTILFEPGQENLAEFLAANRVEVVASLPCYSMENVDRQRGKGVFDKSIAALQKLNALAYGKAGGALKLNLVYNPQGPTLPPDQRSLEDDYRRELHSRFGIEFNQLFVLTNMPIQRFGAILRSKGMLNSYMQLLRDNYVEQNLAQVMCRSLVSVDWQGYLYDCDFNQQLRITLAGKDRLHLRDLLTRDVAGNPVSVANHCYGCTAGQGSSCGGAL